MEVAQLKYVKHLSFSNLARVAQWIRCRSPKPKIGDSSPLVSTLPFAFHVYDQREHLQFVG